MLTAPLQLELDGELVELFKRLTRDAGHPTLAREALRVIQAYEHPPDPHFLDSGIVMPDRPVGTKLVVSGWEKEWRENEYLNNGLFVDIYGDRVEKSLYAVFVELVRFVLDSDNAVLQSKHRRQLKDALEDYLARCGHDTRPPPDEWAELRQFAARDLKGKQQAVVEHVVKADGQMKLADLATLVEWTEPYVGSWTRAQSAINHKLRIAKLPWELRRRNNCATLIRTSADTTTHAALKH